MNYLLLQRVCPRRPCRWDQWQTKIHTGLGLLVLWIRQALLSMDSPCTLRLWRGESMRSNDKHWQAKIHIVLNGSMTSNDPLAPGLRAWWTNYQLCTSLCSWVNCPSPNPHFKKDLVSNPTWWKIRINIPPSYTLVTYIYIYIYICVCVYIYMCVCVWK